MKESYKILQFEELVNLAIKNDKNAEEELLKKAEKTVRNFFYYFDKDFSQINDLVQEILLKVVKDLKSLKNPRYFKRWLHKIMINTYYDYIRRLNIRKKRIKIGLESIEEMETSIENEPDKKILDDELNDKIRGAMQRLSREHRIIVILRDYGEFSYQAISNILNVNEGTVKSRLARARNKLKESLRGYL